MDEMGAPTDQRLQRQWIFRHFFVGRMFLQFTNFVWKRLDCPSESIYKPPYGKHLETPYVKRHNTKQARKP